MASQIIKAVNLDLSNVTFSDLKTDVHGRKMVYVNKNSSKIVVQTPKMYAPNGIKRWRKKDATDNKDDKFEMELSFYGESGSDKNSQEIQQFHSVLEEFDELIKNKVIQKSKEWLGMPKLDKNTLESVMYTPMVKVPKDSEGNELPYPSRVRVKIDRDFDSQGNVTGRFLSNKKFKTDVLVFDESKSRLDFNEESAENCIPKGSQVICVMELVYLSLSKTTISTKWKLVQAKAFKNQQTITDYAMIDEDNEDLDTENDVVEEKRVVKDQEQAEESDEEEVKEDEDSGEVQEDSEVEAEDPEEEVVVQVPVKKPTRGKRGVQA
jgi:hypothetical protein